MAVYGSSFMCNKDVEDLSVSDITENVKKAVKDSGISNGIITVFVEGSTASVSTMEYEPNLKMDVKDALERIAPSSIKYKHHETWGDFNGKSHLTYSHELSSWGSGLIQ